jgi:hypothetical protein
MRPLARVRAALRRAWRREDGTATMEFVIVFPIFVMLLLIGVEAGVMKTRQAMLERALDIAMRDLRLGQLQNPSREAFRDLVCENTAAIRFCEQNLLLELRPISTTTWALPPTPPTCVDRDEEIAPLTQFVEGGGNQLMLIRACFVVDPIFPTTPWGLQLPLDATGGFQMAAASIFVNEPR